MFYFIIMAVFFLLGLLAFIYQVDRFPPIVFFYYSLLALGMGAMTTSHHLLVNMLRYYLYVISGALTLLIPGILLLLALLLLIRSRGTPWTGARLFSTFLGTGLLLLMVLIFLGVLVTQNIAFEVVVEILSQMTIYLVFSLMAFAVLTFMWSALPKSKTHKVLILLGMALEDGNLSRPLKARLDRFLRLYEKGKLPADLVVILTGGAKGEQEAVEAQVMYRYLERSGIPTERLLLEESAHSTKENFLYSEKLIHDLGCPPEEVLVITSRYHIVRAAYLSWRVGLRPDFIGSETSILAYFYHLVRDYIAFMILTHEYNFIFIMCLVFHVLSEARGGW